MEGDARAQRGGGKEATVRFDGDRRITGFTRHFQHTFHKKRPHTEPKFECVRVPFWTYFHRSDVFEVSGSVKNVANDTLF